MARVNVDGQALTDARFAILANLMGVDDPDYALGKMVRLWMQCIERETYVVTKPVIVALFRGATEAPNWLVQAELAEEVEGGLRIKGTRGRIEYLAEKRATARLNGTKGGRPAKPTSVSRNNQRRTPVETPPAPAPAPAHKSKKKEPKTADRDSLFDAVATITGSDPKVTGAHVGKVRTLLAKAEPPYTPDEVIEFGRRFPELCEWAEKDGRTRPTLGEVEKYIGRLRSPEQRKIPPPPRGGFQTHDQRILAQIVPAMLRAKNEQASALE